MAPGTTSSAPSPSPPRPPATLSAPKPAAPPPNPAQVKKARELWYRGVDAFRNGRYEEARQAFAECYALMPKSDVLRNLSISEIQSGRYVDAARHLTVLLSGADLPANVREEATRRLQQAEAQVGRLNVNVDVPGATVVIDGVPVGRTPLDGPWYIEPGQHEIAVSKQGYPQDSRQIYALAGVAIPVTVLLESLRREQERDQQAAELMGTSEGETPRDRGIGTASTVTLISTGALTVLGLVGGLYFTASANEHDDNAKQLAEFLGPSGCGTSTMLTEDCQQLWDEQIDSRNSRRLATASFVGMGVGAAATLGYALWLLLEDDDATPRPGAGRRAGGARPNLELPMLQLNSGGASLRLQGQF